MPRRLPHWRPSLTRDQREWIMQTINHGRTGLKLAGPLHHHPDWGTEWICAYEPTFQGPVSVLAIRRKHVLHESRFTPAAVG